jgi:signal transduction histidine kinase/CheY-like chemotaxis protein/HPt (histidine-containing phosphotransfer) domain-containing protein/CHASE3 domain sensor protein
MKKFTSFNFIVLIGFILAGIVVSVVGFITIRTLQNLVATMEIMSEPNPVLQKADELQALIADSEKALRVSSVSPNKEFFALYIDLLNNANSKLDTLLEMAHEERDHLLIVDSLIDQKIDMISSHIVYQIKRNINGEHESLSGAIEEKEGKILSEQRKNDLLAEADLILEEGGTATETTLTDTEIRLLEKDMRLSYQINVMLGNIENNLQQENIEKAGEAKNSAVLAAYIIYTLIVLGGLVIFFLVYFIFRANNRSLKYREELINARDAAERQAAVKETFLAGMSHEIRTPMNVILGFTEQLQKRVEDAVNSRYINGIKRSADHLLRLINDLLDHSKIESGKLNIENIGFYRHEIIEDVYMLLKDKAAEKNLHFGYTIKDDLPEIFIGDPVRLKQILINLADNAIKFTSEGSVEIICEKHKDYGNYLEVKFTVRDTGKGVSKDKRAELFKEFSQLEPGTARKFGGSGLGLSICKKLVEMQGGEIFMTGEEGKGSDFTFILPYKKGNPSDVNIEMSTESVPNYNTLKGKRILVVDDEQFNRELAKIILEQCDIQVEEADSGFKAIELIKKKDYDAVLMDIQMPDFDGLDTVKVIRSMPTEKALVPVIALTAHVKKDDRELYLSRGMSDYLSKPFKEKELLQKLSFVLGLREENISFPHEKKIVTSKEKTPAPKASDEVLYDLNELNKITRGDKEFFKKIIELFIENTPSNTEKMKQSMDDEDWNKVGAIAHKLRPSFAHMGMKDLAEELKSIEENSFARENLDETKDMISDFCAKSFHVVDQLEDLLNHKK